MKQGSRYLYWSIAWLFVLGVSAQVFLAGMVVVAGRMGWGDHTRLGHALGLPLLAMLITAYTGRLPGRMKRLTWLLVLVYIIQADVVISLRVSAPHAAALHPVLALADFGLGWTLARKAGALVRQPAAVPAAAPEREARAVR